MARAVPDKRFLAAQACIQEGDLDAASDLLSSLLAEAGDNLSVLQLAARVAAMRSDWPVAACYLRQALTIEPDNIRCQYEFAVARQMLGDLNLAITDFRQIVLHMPGYADAHRRLADCLAQQGLLNEACEHYQRVLELCPVEYHTLVSLGRTMAALAKNDEFMRCCETFIERFPDLPGPHFQCAVLHQQAGDFNAAEAYYRAVLLRAPDWYQAHWYLGLIYRVRGDLPAARDCLRTALQFAPEEAEILALLSDVAEAMNDVSEAELLATQALSLQAGNVLASRVLATLLRRRNEPAEGYRLLSRVALPEDAHEAQGVLFELGKLADANADYALAFGHFQQANRQLAVAQRAAAGDKQSYLDRIDYWRHLFVRPWINSWRERKADDGITAPVFLVGFPRSGTTLLDQVLDCHPDIQVLEEQPFMARLQAEIERLTGADLAQLATLPDKQWYALRQYYQQQVMSCGRYDGSALLVDKMPLNLVNAGLCHWLFPEARFILALRHPCDVCLSCFMQPFSHNNAMASFYCLDDSAYLYNQAMSLWQQYIDRLPISFQTHRYEALLNDFEGTVRQLLGFLGLSWHDAMKAFDRHARARGHINTPSYNQVAQPIYQSAKFRWRHYETQMAPVLPLLQPWSKHFGYE